MSCISGNWQGYVFETYFLYTIIDMNFLPFFILLSQLRFFRNSFDKICKIPLFLL
jgi:hypothetical protein